MEGGRGGLTAEQEELWHKAQSELRNSAQNTKFKMASTMSKQQNQKKERPRRRLPSRQSGANFTNLDFDYRGNSSEILHLLKIRENSGSPNVSQLCFELGLRNYIGNFTKSPKKEGEEETALRPMWKYIPSIKDHIPEDVPPIKNKKQKKKIQDQ